MYNLSASSLLFSTLIRAVWTSINYSTHTSLFTHWYLLINCSDSLTSEKWGHLGRRGASGEKGSRAAGILCTWCTWCDGNHVSTLAAALSLVRSHTLAFLWTLDYLYLQMNTLQQGVGTHMSMRIKLTFTCLPIKLQCESNRTAAVNSSRCIFTCTITATIIYSACF